MKLRHFPLFILGFLLSACGGGDGGETVPAHVLVQVTDDGGLVAGATIWVPADVTAQGFMPLRTLVDSMGNACEDPPEPAIFAACTGADGLALLPCADHALFVLKYRSGDFEGVTHAICSFDGVVSAPL